MKAASAPLIALLETGVFQTCDLYKITLVGGTVMRFATSDTDVLVGTIADIFAEPDVFDPVDIFDPGSIYGTRGLRIVSPKSRARGHWKVGLDVDTWRFQVFPRNIDPVTEEAFPDKIGSQPWLAAAKAGALDGAEVQVDRAYFSEWTQPWRSPLVPVGVVTIFVGLVGPIEVFRTYVDISVNSHLELLSVQMPRNAYQSGCRHTLFDTGCALDPELFAQNGTAGAGSTQSQIISSVAAPPGSATYTLGRIKMTSGANNLVTRMVKLWSGGILHLMNPLPFTVIAGDTFRAYAGCDKTLAACALFGNTANNGSFPYIPAPETAI